MKRIVWVVTADCSVASGIGDGAFGTLKKAQKHCQDNETYYKDNVQRKLEWEEFDSYDDIVAYHTPNSDWMVRAFWFNGGPVKKGEMK